MTEIRKRIDSLKRENKVRRDARPQSSSSSDLRTSSSNDLRSTSKRNQSGRNVGGRVPSQKAAMAEISDASEDEDSSVDQSPKKKGSAAAVAPAPAKKAASANNVSLNNPSSRHGVERGSQSSNNVVGGKDNNKNKPPNYTQPPRAPSKAPSTKSAPAPTFTDMETLDLEQPQSFSSSPRTMKKSGGGSGTLSTTSKYQR